MTVTTNKKSTTKTATVAKKVAKSAKTAVAYEDRRRWVQEGGRKDGKVPTASTMGIDYGVRDALYAHMNEIGAKTLSETVEALLADAGWDVDNFAKSVGGEVDAF